MLSNELAAEGFSELAAAEEVQVPPAKFWTAYARGLLAMYSQTPFDLPQLKLNREERTWWPYLRFMHCVVNGDPVGETVDEMSKQFELRNMEKGVASDVKQIDGDAERPVKWDLRKEALFRITKRVYSIELPGS